MVHSEQNMVTDRELSRQITDAVAHFNAASSLHLYTNEKDPAADDVEDLYDEANFAGYEAADLAGDWEAPVRDAAGQYSTRTGEHTFEPTAGVQVIEGIYVKDDEEVIMARRLTFPVAVEPGSPFKVTVVYRHYAAAVLVELILAENP